MQFLINAGSALARTLFRIMLFIVAVVFALVLLCVGLLGLLFVLLKALVTGRKPVFMTSFIRFQQASQQFTRGQRGNSQSAQGDIEPTGTVIEGQAIEVRDDTALPHKREPGPTGSE